VIFHFSLSFFVLSFSITAFFCGEEIFSNILIPLSFIYYIYLNLMTALGIAVNIFNYNHLIQISASLILIVHKPLLLPSSLSLLLYPLTVTNYIIIDHVAINRYLFIIAALCCYHLIRQKSFKKSVYTIFNIHLCSYFYLFISSFSFELLSSALPLQ
jgi:hypothetical protein